MSTEKFNFDLATFCLFFLSLSIVFNASAQTTQERKKLTKNKAQKTKITKVEIFGDDSYFPYSFVQDGNLIGFYPALIHQIAKGLPEFQITLTPIPWKRGLKAMERGTGFALIPPYRFEEERPYIQPYSLPLYTEAVTIFCRPDSLTNDFKGIWPKDYLGLTFSTNLGFKLFNEETWKPIKSGDINHIEIQGTEENLFQLAVTGMVDCYANDRNSISLGIKQLKQKLIHQKREALLNPIQETAILLQQNGYIGYSKKFRARYPKTELFITRFDNAIAKFKASGDYQSFVDHYWKQQVHQELAKLNKVND